MALCVPADFDHPRPEGRGTFSFFGWPRNCANRLLVERMAAHGWLDGDGARGFTPSDDGAAAIRALDAGRAAPDWNRPLGALF